MSSVFPLRWMVMTQGCCWAEKKASSAVRSAGGLAVQGEQRVARLDAGTVGAALVDDRQHIVAP